ncbi:hypothetical protein ACWDKQ_02635 [Saccharopolyspora sp. NPDC000995]
MITWGSGAPSNGWRACCSSARAAEGRTRPTLKGMTKFTLLFIPLFPTSTRYALTCTWCGTTSPISKEEAEQLQAQAQPQPRQGLRS